MDCHMRHPIHLLSTKSWPLAAAWLVVGLSRLSAQDADGLFIQVAPAVVVGPAPALAPVEEAKPAKENPKKKETSRLVRLGRPISYPTIFPNPLAFNMTWSTITDNTFAQIRALAARQKALARRAALVLPAQAVVNQKAVQQQMRKLFEPMLKTELSFAARVTDLNQDERRKLTADGKAWFEKFLVDFLKKQDPNQQQMLLQGMQGVWFGNQQQKTEGPRDAIRVGVAKLVKDTLPKEKVAAYTDECRKRDEFARQVSVDNLVERIDEKVKLSPDQWKKITKSLNEHWDKNRDPQLEAFALNQAMWPGAPHQWVLPELSPAQQAVLKRINTMSGRMFIHGGVFGQMFGGDGEVLNDMNVEVNVDVNVEVVQPAAAAAPLDPFE